MLTSEDLHNIIISAKLGRERKGAQVETCAVFSSALHHVLAAHGMESQCYSTTPADHLADWSHGLVMFDGSYFDSMGRFSDQILASRMRPKTKYVQRLKYEADLPDFNETDSDYGELFTFFVERLTMSLNAHMQAEAQPMPRSSPIERRQGRLAASG